MRARPGGAVPLHSESGLEELVPAAATTAWMLGALPELQAPLDFRQVGGGHSNITVRVQDADGRRVVLRRPPRGAAGSGSHDVRREARFVGALAGSGVPVATVLAVCHEDAVLGTPFTVSAWVEGDLVDTPQAALGLSVERRTCAAEDMVEKLALLHAGDPAEAGIDDLLRPEPLLGRQLRRYSGIWASHRTAEQPLVDDVYRRLARACPSEGRRGLVHGDYRLGNVLLDPGGRIAAVLDWELASVGDVLIDLALLLNNWELPHDPSPSLWMQPPPTRAGGFPDREQLVARYVAASGLDVADLPYHRALAWWRMAVIADGIARRYLAGGMGSAAVDLQHVRERVAGLAELADAQLRAYGA